MGQVMPPYPCWRTLHAPEGGGGVTQVLSIGGCFRTFLPHVLTYSQALTLTANQLTKSPKGGFGLGCGEIGELNGGMVGNWGVGGYDRENWVTFRSCPIVPEAQTPL